MAKSNAKQADTWQKPHPSYAYKPLNIGTVIKNISEKKRITPIQLEKRLGLANRNVYRFFKSKQMSLPMMLKMSEALEENLLSYYHPNVKPAADALKDENALLRAENEQLKAQLLQLNELQKQNIVLQAKLEVLSEVMKTK